MQIVGFSGYAGSGKDTAAEALIDVGWERISFADPMREMAYAIDPVIGWDDDYDFVRYTDAIECYDMTYTEVKLKYPEFRRFLQRLGTEGGRNILGENIWVDTARSRMDPNGSYVVPDVRFANEVAAIHDLGGFVIRVNREGVGPANDHASEKLPVLDPDAGDITLVNDGTIPDLHDAVLRAYAERHHLHVIPVTPEWLRRERIAIQGEEDTRGRPDGATKQLGSPTRSFLRGGRGGPCSPAPARPVGEVA